MSALATLPPTVAPSRPTRIVQFDGLRALAFLGVFFHHAYHVPLLWMGVDMFFVLSGFLITGILLRMKEHEAGQYFQAFYTRRARRILPPYVLFLAVASLFYTVHWSRVWYWYAFFAANIAEFLKVGGGGPLRPLWSLAVEEQFYLAWPLLVYFLPRRKLFQVLIGAVLTVPVLRGLATFIVPNHWAIYFLTPFRLDLLAAGSLLALFWEREETQVWGWHPKARQAMFVLALVFAGFCLAPGFRTGANSLLFNVFGYSISMAFFTCLVTCTLTLRQGPVYQILTSRPLTYLGGISYMMYLVHELMLRITHNWGILLGPLLALALTISFSALSWKFLENPILHFKPGGRSHLG